MKHHIRVLDYEDGRPNGRTLHIFWDDVAGTVTGDHYQVHALQKDLAGPMPYETGDEAAFYKLQDPGHNAADFLTFLSFATRTLAAPDVLLPESLQGIEPTPPIKVFTLTPEEIEAGVSL